MITATSNGLSAFPNTTKRLEALRSGIIFANLKQYGQEGVNALSAATPAETGESAGSWSYEVRKTGSVYEIIWSNTHMAGGTPVVILLQYGHGTGTGGYVQGRDFINPVIKPLFERIRVDMRRAVGSV